MKLVPFTTEILGLIDKHPSFFIIPHIEPDGDCIGSALALASFLRRLGKRCYLHNLGPFERRDIKQYATQFVGRIDPALLAKEPDALAIVLDCSTIDRIGDLAEDIMRLPILVIDHHSSGKEFGTYRHINASAPSATLLVQQFIEALDYQPTPEEAELLFFGFSTDTGFFRHLEADSGEAFRMVSRLVDIGASPKAMHARLNSGASFIGRKHLGTLLSRAESYADGKLLISWEYKTETEAIGRQNRESDLLYQLLTGIEGVEVVAVLREESAEQTTGGLRSRFVVDVGSIALEMGGGGHIRASGFLYPKNLEETKKKLIPLLLSALA